MKIIIKKNKKEAAHEAAKIVVAELQKNARLVLGLATGKTMIPFYKELVSQSKKQKISFSQVTTFNLDEYVGISSENKKSFRYFMEKNFFSKVDLQKSNINFLNGMSKNFSHECARYELALARSGGIDLQILGIGRNAHIAFNEPGSSEKSKTRKVELSKETIKINSSPKSALTVGISTILRSKKIILLAFGKEKSQAIYNALHAKVSSNVPASFLREHKNATFILDEKAFSNIKKLK